MGVVPGLKAFVAAVLGGIGNIPGAALGALILGMVETFVDGSRKELVRLERLDDAVRYEIIGIEHIYLVVRGRKHDDRYILVFGIGAKFFKCLKPLERGILMSSRISYFVFVNSGLSQFSQCLEQPFGLFQRNEIVDDAFTADLLPGEEDFIRVIVHHQQCSL